MASTLFTKGQLATTSLVTMYTVASGTSMIFKIHCANKSSTATPKITVKWNDGANDFTILENYPIPIGGAEDLLAQIGKKILENGDILKIQSDLANAIDVTIDGVNIT